MEIQQHKVSLAIRIDILTALQQRCVNNKQDNLSAAVESRHRSINLVNVAQNHSSGSEIGHSNGF